MLVNVISTFQLQSLIDPLLSRLLSVVERSKVRKEIIPQAVNARNLQRLKITSMVDWFFMVAMYICTGPIQPI